MLKKSLNLTFKLLRSAPRYYSSALPADASTQPVDHDVEFVNDCTIEMTNNSSIPTYRVLKPNGQLTDTSVLPTDKNLPVRMCKYMISINEMDKVLYECQRQGRISFYMTAFGEEATVIGSAAGLKDDDLIFPQYREAGILIWRGFTVEQCINQCFGNKLDIQKSKQMPIHYGSKQHNFVTISSPIATQLPQAAGAAYAYKLSRSNKCVVAYFGDGASSEGDTHAALNFASTLECPVIFICRNNKYAISTPVEEQFSGNDIASRAIGYNMPGIKVDGNDIFAVYYAVQKAREYVTKWNKPILIEVVTYRKGHHSTSDDSLAYRSEEDIKNWDSLDPIARLRLFLIDQGLWSEQEETAWIMDVKQQILSAVNKAEKVKKPKWDVMFDDVYDRLPENLSEQKNFMMNHLKKFGDNYPVDEFEK